MKLYLCDHRYQQQHDSDLGNAWKTVTDGISTAWNTWESPPYNAGIIHAPAVLDKYKARQMKWANWAQRSVVVFCSSQGVPLKPFISTEAATGRTMYVFGIHRPFGEMASLWPDVLGWLKVACNATLGLDETLTSAKPTVRQLLAPVDLEYCLAVALLCDLAGEVLRDSKKGKANRSRSVSPLATKLCDLSWWRASVVGEATIDVLREHLAYEYNVLGSALPKNLSALMTMLDTGPFDLCTVDNARSDIKAILKCT